eukprot:7381819-Prymnesium_polylepis.1
MRCATCAALVLAACLPLSSCGQQSIDRALSCRDRRNQANTRRPFFSSSNAEVAKLEANGITVSLWLRFNFNSKVTQVQPFTINHKHEVNFIQLFGGDQGGLLFGGAAQKVVRGVSDSRQWHHFAFTYNSSSRSLQYFIDGAPYGSPQATTLDRIPIDNDMKSLPSAASAKQPSTRSHTTTLDV